MQIGSKICNFVVTNIRPIPGSNAQLVEMLYPKTGTQLCWLQNGESNKMFCVAFKTVPEDDTGVFHILEHSVLCGSDKYPVKEPFVELLKSSMNTFLNAMTFSDKTVYPVSSRNEQDFLNLTGVYLDAVFAPAILREPNIYRQEGWHYELDQGELTYNGVVFNEMKGAMSSVDQAAYRGLMRVLYPDTCYRFNSGGDPAAIPDLTYGQFIDSYKKYYHPTNARIFLDGDIPVEKTFALLDSYLSRYDMGEKQQLTLQAPMKQELTISYEAVNDGTPKAQLLLGKILGRFDEKLPLLARDVLCDVLAGSNDAPLKQAALQTGLCQDLTLTMVDGMLQPFMMLRLHNIDPASEAKLEAAIQSCAEQLIADGIPTEQLIASINRFAFQMQQMREPQALTRCLNCLNSWLYEGDPMLYLQFGESIEALRKMAENGQFLPLLREMLLDESGLCKLHVLPSDTHGAQLRQAETARLVSEKAAMSDAQLQQIKETFSAFTQWQQTADTPENLASLPKLNLSQIASEPVMCETEAGCDNGVTVLRHRVSSNGIVHLSAYFRLTDRSLPELTQLTLLGKLLGSLPTARYSASQLQNQIKTWLGELRFGIEVFSRPEDRKSCTPVLAVHCSVLQENLSKAEELIHEILTATDLHQHERIRQILLQTETEQQQRSIMSGHTLALQAAHAHFSAAAAVTEATSGITYIQCLHSLSKDFETRLPEFTQLLQQTLAEAVCRLRMTVSFTEDSHSCASGFISRFPQGTAIADVAVYKTQLPRRLGIRIPAQVSYASLGYHVGDAGLAYDGTARLLSNILSLAHLWNEVRVQGGAYGAGMRIVGSGGMFTYSYRDPNPSRTLDVYRNMGAFVKAFAESDEDITGFIISTVAETEPLISPAQQGAIADSNYYAGFDRAKAQAERRALLQASSAQLSRWCPTLDALRTDASVCVVGYADALAACEKENLTVVDI